MINQTVNLRHGVPSALQFVDDAGEQAYHREVEAARAAQTFRFAVAPRCSVPSKRGVLEAGAEVRAEDFDPAHDEHGAMVLSPLARLHRLVLEGVVLERW